MKLFSGVVSSAVAIARFESFEPLTDVLPTDLPAVFDCEGSGRIVGGTFAPVAWSHNVQFRNWKTETQAQNQPDNHGLCGGVIIHDKWVLTAAHCCEETNQKYNEFHFGAKGYNDSKFSMVVDRSAFTIHPDWTDKTDDSDMNSDYCLVELPESVNDKRQENCGDNMCATRVCLPKQAPTPGAACWVGGFGVEDYAEDEVPAALKSIGVNIFSEEYTKAKAKSILWNDIIFFDEFCAGLPDANNDGFTDAGGDSCSGDSGGGLVCREDDKLIVYGLSSWGDNCGKKGKPSVYANVFAAMSWIENTIGAQVTTTKQTTTTTKTVPTTPTTPSAGDCPDMEWKGKGATKLMYRGVTNGNRSYILRQTIFNNSENHPNLRETPYTGFFMFARKHCGVDFFNALTDGSIELGIYDYEDTYEIMHQNTRIDGSTGSQVTFQYYQNRVGESDAPWTKKNGNSVKKDQFFLSITGIPDTFDVAKEETCFNILTGVLPTGSSNTEDWTACASTQKDSGF